MCSIQIRIYIYTCTCVCTADIPVIWLALNNILFFSVLLNPSPPATLVSQSSRNVSSNHYKVMYVTFNTHLKPILHSMAVWMQKWFLTPGSIGEVGCQRRNQTNLAVSAASSPTTRGRALDRVTPIYSPYTLWDGCLLYGFARESLHVAHEPNLLQKWPIFLSSSSEIGCLIYVT